MRGHREAPRVTQRLREAFNILGLPEISFRQNSMLAKNICMQRSTGGILLKSSLQMAPAQAISGQRSIATYPNHRRPTFWSSMSQRSMSTGPATCLKITIGNRTISEMVSRHLEVGEIDKLVARAADISSDAVHSLRYFSYKPCQATSLNRDTIVKSLNSGMHTSIIVASSDIRYCEYDGEVDQIPLSKSYFFADLHNQCRELFGLKEIPRRHTALFQRLPNGAYSFVDLTQPIPSIEKDSSSGFLWQLPIMLRRTDLLKVRVGASEKTISVAGCKTYRGVAESLLEYFPLASSVDQIRLSYSDGLAIDLDTDLPAYSPDEGVRVLEVKMRERRILFCVEMASGERLIDERVIRSNSHILNICDGFLEADDDGDPIEDGRTLRDRRIVDYLLLKDGGNYVPFLWLTPRHF